MKRHILILCFCLLALSVSAEVTLILRSGQQITGTILFKNEEVVVLQDIDGKRYQYPQAEVQSVLTDVEPEQDEQTVRVTKGKRIGMSLHVGGGAGWLPEYATGGMVSGDVYMGGGNVAKKHIFIGAGVGYHAFFCGGKTYSFIPVQVRFAAPLMQTKHAPALGASVGYGFQPKNQGKGGMYAALDFGWRCQLQEKTALFAGLTAAMQQGRATVEETFSGNTYSNTGVRTFSMIGMKVALQF